MGSKYIAVDCEILHMTGDALFLSDGDVEQWVSRSLVKDGQLFGYDDINKSMTLEIEEWIAIEKEFV